jgi:large subunit ribosomal protein L25
MKSIAIKSSARTVLGKKQATLLRRIGIVPCVLYGGKEVIHFSAPEMEFKKLVYTPDVYTVDLNVDGKEYKAVMKDIDFHPVTDRIVHIDFMELDAAKPVVMQIPIKLVGTSQGAREGGLQVNKLRKLKVKALPAHLPDRIEVNIEKMGVGKAIRIGDVSIPNIEILDAPNNIITAVKMARTVVEDKSGDAKKKDDAKK